jgi:aryl-alcohol dehydrogenase-like predicted oxidoreductase
MNNRLVLGTAQLGLPYGIANKQGQVRLDEAKTILEYAASNGIDMLDTAIAYGESEQRLGEIGVQDWHIVSKLPAVPDDCHDLSQWVEDSVKVSLQRLKVNSLYGLLLHRPRQLLGQDGEHLYGDLQHLKETGLVQKIGVSIYDPADLDILMRQYCFDIVQAPFNILDRRLIDTGYLSKLAEYGTELHVRSVFLQGLLLMKPGDRPHKFDRWASFWSKWEEWQKHAGLTPLQACLRYNLSFTQITKVIVGVDSLVQLKEILQGAKGPAPEIPDEFRTNDQDLINPAKWDILA